MFAIHRALGGSSEFAYKDAELAVRTELDKLTPVEAVAVLQVNTQIRATAKVQMAREVALRVSVPPTPDELIAFGGLAAAAPRGTVLAKELSEIHRGMGGSSEFAYKDAELAVRTELDKLTPVEAVAVLQVNTQIRATAKVQMAREVARRVSVPPTPDEVPTRVGRARATVCLTAHVRPTTATGATTGTSCPRPLPKTTRGSSAANCSQRGQLLSAQPRPPPSASAPEAVSILRPPVDIAHACAAAEQCAKGGCVIQGLAWEGRWAAPRTRRSDGGPRHAQRGRAHPLGWPDFQCEA